MEVIEPQRAIYEMHVEHEKIALLYDPIFEEMFWCSYRIEAISESANKILRDKDLWERVGFTIKDECGGISNPYTFSGGYTEFCNGETDRISFRSLRPPRSRIVAPKSQSIWNTIKGWLR